MVIIDPLTNHIVERSLTLLLVVTGERWSSKIVREPTPEGWDLCWQKRHKRQITHGDVFTSPYAHRDRSHLGICDLQNRVHTGIVCTWGPTLTYIYIEISNINLARLASWKIKKIGPMILLHRASKWTNKIQNSAPDMWFLPELYFWKLIKSN